jgi:hypothetical protein
MLNNNHPRQILLSGRSIFCESSEDRTLLMEAKALSETPASALDFTVGRLQLIKDACQHYSLGAAQRVVKRAIDNAGRQ